MRQSFHHRMVNRPFEDPCLYVRLPWQKRALLFDSGDLNRLSHGDIVKISDLFITHTHIDHFIGFDTIVRALLRRESPFSVYGPLEIIERVEGKLKGYSWNLIESYPLKIYVHAIDNSVCRKVSFQAANRFRLVEHGSIPFDGTVLKDPLFTVRAAMLDHGIGCLAFSLEEEMHINIDKAALMDMGLPVGPWLSSLKHAVRGNLPEDTSFEVSGAPRYLKDLRRLIRITEGQKVSYVTDASPDDENVRKIVSLVRGSDTLYCEAYFIEADRERAVQRSHLTSSLAGKIARLSGVKKLVPIHFSPRYVNSTINPGTEAMEEFSKGS